MNQSLRELLLLLVIFGGAVWFMVAKITSDLPDDFLDFVRKRKEEGGDGGLRDNG